jgi:hypothetical protein
VVAAVEANRLNAQLVGVRTGRRFQRQGAAAGLVPGWWRDDDQAFDFRSGGNLVELVAVCGDDQNLRDDQDAQRISL